MERGRPLHTYKIGLFGPMSSGKTSILASMAMKRRLHPGGVTIDQILNPWENKNLNIHKALVKEYVMGQEWISDAAKAIRKKAPPQANPRTTDRRILFMLTHDDPYRRCRVEIVDYSGELVDPESDATQQRKQLLDHFRSLDGILILAEVPDQTMPQSARSIDILAEALNGLTNHKEMGSFDKSPIGIIVNKWDRVHGYNPDDLPGQIDKLHRMLRTTRAYTPHANLWKSVSRLTPTLSKDSGEEPAAFIYPVSAFGNTECIKLPNPKDPNNASAYYVPKHVDFLDTFALEDAILKIILMKDRLDQQRLQESIDRASPWRLFDPGGLISMRPKPTEMLTRLPKSPEIKALAKRAKRRALGVTLGQCAIIAASALLIQQGSQAVRDYPKIQKIAALIEASPEVRTPEKVAGLETWLSEYAFNERPELRRLSYVSLMSREEGAATYELLSAEREATLCERVKTSKPASEERFSAADIYLRSYMDQPCAISVQGLVIGDRLQLDIDAVGQRLQRARNDLVQAESNPDILAIDVDTVRSGILEIEIPSNPQEIVPERPVFGPKIEQLEALQIEKGTLLDFANAFYGHLVCKEEVQRLQDALDEGFLDTAVSHYDYLSDNCADTAPSSETFLAQIEQSFIAIVKNRVRSGDFADLADRLSSASQSTRLLELDAENEGGLAGRIRQAQVFVARLSEKRDYDRLRHEWNNWDPLSPGSRAEKLQSLLQNYEGRYATGLMAKDVSSARWRYDSLTSGSHTISLRMQWLRACVKGPGFQLRIAFAGQQVADYHFQHQPTGCPTTVTWANYRSAVTVRDLGSAKHLNVSLSNYSFEGILSLIGFDNEGSASVNTTVALQQLRNGQTFGMTATGVHLRGSSPAIHIQMVDWPKRSYNLPGWSAPIIAPEWLE